MSLEETCQKLDNLEAAALNTLDTLIRSYKTDSPLKAVTVAGLLPFSWRDGYGYHLRWEGKGDFYVFSNTLRTGSEQAERQKFGVWGDIQAEYEPIPVGIKMRESPAGSLLSYELANQIQSVKNDAESFMRIVEHIDVNDAVMKSEVTQDRLLDAQADLPTLFEREQDSYLVRGEQVSVERGGMGGATAALADDIVRSIGGGNAESAFIEQRQQTMAALLAAGEVPEEEKYMSLHEKRKRGLTGRRPLNGDYAIGSGKKQ